MKADRCTMLTRDAVSSLVALAIGWGLWFFSAPLAGMIRLDDFDLIFRGGCVVIGLSVVEFIFARLGNDGVAGH